MATDLKEKVKQLERRIDNLEILYQSKKSIPTSSYEALRAAAGMWSKKPRTTKDLNRIRRRIWGQNA